MRLRHTLIAGALLSALAAGVAIGQSLITQNLLGTEIIEFSAGLGGTLGNTQVLNLRNGTAFKTFSGSGTPTYTALTKDSTLYWVGTAPTSWTITTPAAPFDGEILSIGTDTTLTSKVTVTANTGQTMNTSFSGATISAASSVEFQYSASTTKWYELR